MKYIYRQGDILLKPIQKLSLNIKLISLDDSFVLAESEITGYKHLLISEPQMLEVYQDDQGRYYINLKKDSFLIHPEHKKLIIKAGFYVVEKETEFDYFEYTIKTIKD
jgi:hypothetical protein